jgi:glycosyltransferase involved in cell wall biosynthesis
VVLLYTRFFEFSQQKLYRIFSQIHRQVPGVRFLIVGRGRKGEENRLLDAAKDGGFSDALVMAGWVEPADLPEYLSIGDVAIYPLDDTLVNRCKCPAKLTELLVNGIAVVADGIGQAKEYIHPANSESLCNAGDGEEMAAIAATLLTSPVSRRTLGESNRHYLLDNFNWHTYAIKLQNFYEEHTFQ